jgi:predicted  nucleic acid-binding Zn-ribbon protein
MNPQIAALYDLQHRDRLLNQLERKLDSIPARLKELDGDLGKLESMLEAERKKCDETKQFQKAQQAQLSDEEELVRQSKAKINQVKTARELSATQRELESTRRMITTRGDEINKLQAGVLETEQRIAAMQTSLEELRTSATAEKTRLAELREKLEGRITKLRTTRSSLTSKLDREVLGTYERIRKRLGGLAFVPAHRERCMACKMVVPHQVYVVLRKGDDIPACESCGRMLYWSGHFPDDKPDEPAPKASPPKVRPGAAED